MTACLFRILALEYCKTFHNQYLIHLDVKPQNILISGDSPEVIKWADSEMSSNMAEGLHYIHSQGVNGSQSFIYRDVKPDNILISYDNPAVMKWADFGLSRVALSPRLCSVNSDCFDNTRIFRALHSLPCYLI